MLSLSAFPDPSSPPQHRSLGRLVAQTARQWRRAVDRQLQPYGLTEATWLPLLHIARANEPMRQKDLAASISLDGSSVVRLLDELQLLGFIVRQEGADRRAKVIRLTERGAAVVERVEGIAALVRQRELVGVADRDVDTVVNVLSHVCDALASPTEDVAE
jgi:MarR family transcriptional regulator for hemolysin